MMIMSAFSTAVKEMRKKNGLSQKELGEKLNISQSTIGNWEVAVSEPNTATLVKLSKFFNISIDVMLGALDPMITFDNLLNTQFELTVQEQILLSAYREMGGYEEGKQQQEIIFNLTIDLMDGTRLKLNHSQ
jgi:transcriptional regulator with XRE-family HTH domain